uniref:Protein kinase domain-containing protein n=1 Tax=Parascaris equorum TaxID=6256 RepID=A0A914R119_PAREQ
MTLYGHSLNFLLRRCRCCSTSTQVRVGINILYGIKQLHEVGFVHRDIKPANLAVGRRTVHYCSTNTHARKEQGRADDLWSMLYVLAEMKGPLPWDRIRCAD